MEPDKILNFIKQRGYNTLEEIEEHFSGENMEIVHMQLEYLVDNKVVGKAVYAASEGHGSLYYVVYHKG